MIIMENQENFIRKVLLGKALSGKFYLKSFIAKSCTRKSSFKS